jgi:hypothetical protein
MKMSINGKFNAFVGVARFPQCANSYVMLRLHRAMSELLLDLELWAFMSTIVLVNYKMICMLWLASSY